MKRLVRWLVISAPLFLIAANLIIEIRASGRVFSKLYLVSANDVGLVLGTSRMHGAYENPFFAGRIAAAAELYRSGKVRHLLLSGDNHTADYDEPTDMRDALVDKGIPADDLTLDYAGFRTLDSFERARKVFGLTRLTIVTDDFHAPRSVLLARHFGIDAIAYSSPPVPMKWSAKPRLREIAARCKAVLDLYVLRTKPHFLGPPIELPHA